jgi:hypothetical protein
MLVSNRQKNLTVNKTNIIQRYIVIYPNYKRETYYLTEKLGFKRCHFKRMILL